MNTRKITENYVRWACEHQQCTFSGDHRKGNKYADKLDKYNRLFVNGYDESVREMIDIIVESNNPGAVMWIASVCKKLQYRLPEVKEKVISYSKDTKLGLYAVTAEILLEQL